MSDSPSMDPAEILQHIEVIEARLNRTPSLCLVIDSLWLCHQLRVALQGKINA